jgi:maltose alpha-D-glucosyltransferase / alpha-amylase
VIDRAAVSAAVRSLDLPDLASRRWYVAKGEVPSSARLAHAFALVPECALALVDVRSGERGERAERYAVPFVLRDGVVREAAEGDGAWRALAAAIAEGRTIPSLAREGPAGQGEEPVGGSTAGQVDAALVCRPSPGFASAWAAGAPLAIGADPPGPTEPTLDPVEPSLEPGPGAAGLLLVADEVPLGREQSNTSTIIGGRLLLKAYRRLQPGLNPDLELTAYLAEEAGFPGVPRLAGYAEAVTRDGGVSTVAMLQAFVAGADDLYERTAEFLAELVAAPGRASMEWATEVAAELGTLVAGLHAALATPPADAPELAPREATHDELKAWRMDAHRQLNRAIEAVSAVDGEAAAELRREASVIAARVSRFEAVATAPVLTRIHADLHLGQVLVAEDGYRVIDFEGEPLRSIEDRRRPDSPLRDVASLLRSLDHVARSARRRAETRAGGPMQHPGLDVDAWLDRARARFLAAYAEGLRRSGSPAGLDLDLLDAFEVAKEAQEFVYAATVLPSWLWAPREGMRWLLERGDPA